MRKRDKDYQLAVIHKLFYRLKTMYGSYWILLLGDRPIGDIKQEWLKSLDMFTVEEIGKALEVVKQMYPKEPPNMYQFKNLVNQIKHSKQGHLSNRMWESRNDRLKAGKSNIDSYQKHIKQIRDFI